MQFWIPLPDRSADNNVVIALIFFGIIGFASEIINLPFGWYDTFVIEKKYGFNTMSVRTFITDHLKSWFIALLVGIPVLGLITWIYYKTGKGFWLYAWGLITAFSVFINFFYSEWIVPLFNKQTPLIDSPLRTKIEAFAEKTGFRLKNIYVIDGSKRSTKANAYFSGFGSKKRIVLYDTLIKEMSDEEIVAVLAHEIGHYKKKHVLEKPYILCSSYRSDAVSLFPGCRQPFIIQSNGSGDSQLSSWSDSFRDLVQSTVTPDRSGLKLYFTKE